jgi:hypothetical protein
MRVRPFRFRARRLAPCVGRRPGCWGKGRLRCFHRLHLRAHRRSPAPHFAGGLFIDKGRLANRIRGLPRRPFVARRGRMPLPIVSATCQL